MKPHPPESEWGFVCGFGEIRLQFILKGYNKAKLLATPILILDDLRLH